MTTSTDSITPAPVLLRSDDDGIATLTLNRRAQYNALSEDLLTSLQRELDQIAQDEALRVVIIAAEGKAFCAGHDLKEMRASEDSAFHQALFAYRNPSSPVSTESPRQPVVSWSQIATWPSQPRTPDLRSRASMSACFARLRPCL